MLTTTSYNSMLINRSANFNVNTAAPNIFLITAPWESCLYFWESHVIAADHQPDGCIFYIYTNKELHFKCSNNSPHTNSNI